jgi:ABC-type molybdate transport system substrate-binding protein
VVKGSKNQDTARAFVQFVSEPEGQRILNAYGFKSPDPGKR